MISDAYRYHSDISMKEIFLEDEAEILELYAEKNGKELDGTIGDGVKKLATIGGYTNRTGDLPPGTEIISSGLERLAYIQEGYDLHKRRNEGKSFDIKEKNFLNSIKDFLISSNQNEISVDCENCHIVLKIIMKNG